MINKEQFVIRQNDHLLIFDSYINNRTLEIHYFTKPCAHIVHATKFNSKEDAIEAISQVEDLTDAEPIQIAQLDAEAKKKADEESDTIIKNAWENTSYEKQKEMIDKIRETKGEAEVQKWLNKYGPMKEETSDE